mmetsp:Transcript_44490/g.123113  ORF Transcript_44490/g.123113 Transcript_44490/m.123113 type:complete len:427 (+) Transcript_44490:72-1352(+)
MQCAALPVTVIAGMLLGAFSMELVVPLYKWPDMGRNGSMYDAVANSPFRTVAILNPDNGDSNACNDTMPLDTTWQSVVNLFARKARVRTIGYVHTDYGRRPQSEVMKSIDNYFQCWGVSGIFIDEASTNVSLCNGTSTYYRALYDHIMNLDSMAEIMTNQGTGVDYDVWQHCSTRAMVAEVSQDSWNKHFQYHGAYSPRGSTAMYPEGYAVVIVYGVPTEELMQRTVRQASCESFTNAGGIMVLSEGGGDSLPSYTQLPDYFHALADYIISSWSPECPMQQLTLAPTGGACWWNTTDLSCEVCAAGANQCSYRGCKKRQCSPPDGAYCTNPCLNDFTLAPVGAPCWWDQNDTGCEMCMPGYTQCSEPSCYESACSPDDRSACAKCAPMPRTDVTDVYRCLFRSHGTCTWLQGFDGTATEAMSGGTK